MVELDGRDYISKVLGSSKRRIIETSFRVGTCGDDSEKGSKVKELHVRRRQVIQIEKIQVEMNRFGDWLFMK